VERAVLTVTEAAAALGLSPHTLRGMVRAKAIPHYRVGPRRGHIVFDPADVDRYLRAGRVEPGEARAEEPRPVPAKRYQYRHLALAPRPARGRRAAH
jgi:excisionase family DNA binding protein